MNRTFSPHSLLMIRDVGTSLSDPRHDASKRLAICGLVLGSLCLVYYLLWILFPSSVNPAMLKEMGYTNAISYIMVAMFLISFTIYLIARSGRLSLKQTLDLGLIYEVVLAASIGIGFKLAPGSMRMPNHWGISEACILILIFPVIVPNTPRKTILAALLAASADPLGVYLAGWFAGKLMPPSGDIFYAYMPNYICAGLVLIPAVVIDRLGRQVNQAREMGSYRLIEQLGKGGMGEVWRATHRLLARDAAVKIIKPENLGRGDISETMLARFEREAQATANLHSHHSVQLYDFGLTSNGTFFLVMELLNGLDLESFVKRFGPVTPARAIYFLHQACDSLEDAHRSGLIHRDIKPANILACRYGHQTDYIKVLDFGLVRVKSRTEKDPALTTINAITGTPAYMAPEMTLGGHDIDARVDIYALGCVAYWLVTGHQVFERDQPLQVLGAHLKDDPIPPSQKTELEIGADFEKVILACLAKNPEDRPQSITSVRDLLCSCEINQPWTLSSRDEWWNTHLPI